MEKLIRPLRLAVIALLAAALIVVSVVTLYKLQIVEGKAYYEESQNNIVTNRTVAAARGSLMDRYGRVLVENRVCNNLLIDEKKLFPDSQPETIAAANAALLITALCQIVPLWIFHGTALGALLRTALLQALWSLPFAVPVYFVAKRIAGKVRRP